MTSRDSTLLRFARELRRRRVFRTAGLYVVGAWLVMQAADVFFPGWGLPESALNTLLYAAILGFPLALVFGWFYDITTGGIVRTPGPGHDDREARLPLQQSDFVVLGALILIAGVIVFQATQEIVETPRVTEAGDTPGDFLPVEKLANSVAVLPFENISNDPDNEVFCDGISEEILNKLAAFTELQVIGRTSSFAFKGSDYLIPRISALLGVRYLLQGSVRKHGNQLRISAQLVDENGTQQWSDTFDRTLENIFAIQTEIADLVAGTVVPQIAPRAANGYEPDIAAYQHYLSGREMVRKRLIGPSREELRKAIEYDPNYPDAYAEYAVAMLLGPLGSEELEQARQAIDKALVLRPGLPRALAARGLLLQQQREPDWAASVAPLREALAGDPNMVDAMNWLGSALGAKGDSAGALALLERAARIDPLHETIVTNLANGLVRRGQIDQAEQMVLRQLDMPQPGRRVFMFLRDFYEATGQLAKMNSIEKRQALTGQHVYYGLARSYALLGLWDEAAEWIGRMQRDFPDFFFHGYWLANIPRWRGDYIGASRIFERELTSRGARLKSLSPYFSYYYGTGLARGGEYAAAIETLQPMYGGDIQLQDTLDYDGSHALAWAYAQLGDVEKAHALLDETERGLSDFLGENAVPNSFDWFYFAQNAVVIGDLDIALDRLQKAIDAGWRQYYLHRHDPLWDALADNNRYIEMMAWVKADIDRQRAEVQRIDAAEDFPALHDRVRAARNNNL
jgi:TolB-like protein/Tfp pilus assembly protein PilF